MGSGATRMEKVKADPKRVLGKRVGTFKSFQIIPLGEPTGENQGMTITLKCSEFTCRCPVTNQPDYATLEISYVPTVGFVETKSLKLFLETFREQPIFHEFLVWQIHGALNAVLKPKSLTVTAKFNTRGGIAVEASAYSFTMVKTNE